MTTHPPPPFTKWQRALESLSPSSPLWVGILNTTPDSFSDGGDALQVERGLAVARRLLEEGVHALDIGGQSTRPGAVPIGPSEEWLRVAPLLRALRASHPDTPLSLDTSHPSVALAAAHEGLVDMINDVKAGRGRNTEAEHHTLLPELPGPCAEKSTLDVASAFQLGFVAMHMQGTPETMQHAPLYADPAREVFGFLKSVLDLGRAKGVPLLWLDPGIGFGKKLHHNMRLLGEGFLQGLRDQLKTEVYVGISRKRFLAELHPQLPLSDPKSRDHLTKQWEWSLARRGVRVVRSHRGPQVASEFTSTDIPLPTKG